MSQVEKNKRGPVGIPAATLDGERRRGTEEARGTILVACGDPSETRAIAKILSAEGWTPRVAASAEEALQIFTGAPDGGEDALQVIVLGLPLAGYSERIVAEAARRTRTGAGVPILALIPAGGKGERNVALEAGACEILSRPLEGAALLGRVRSLATIHRLQSEAEESRRTNRINEERLGAIRAERAALGHRVSHDLGNPLTGILGHAQMLQMRSDGAHPEVGRYAGRILKAARQIQQILADVRDLGLLEEGQMSLHQENIDLHAAITSVVEDFREAAAADGVELEVEPRHPPAGGSGPIVSVDAGLLIRIVGNFLADAVRHTPPEGTVRVHVSVPSDGRVEVHVSDIAAVAREAPEDASRAGDVIAPGPTRSPRPERGLRLAFCRAALAAHGGRMWVKPNAAGGDTLGFLLPVEGGNRGERPAS